ALSGPVRTVAAEHAVDLLRTVADEQGTHDKPKQQETERRHLSHLQVMAVERAEMTPARYRSKSRSARSSSSARRSSLRAAALAVTRATRSASGSRTHTVI